ncbi:glutaredoxin family protein, partial [Mycobacterium tuberculosis]|nr:glutaredoxin family protein [Mycobacterium tuberculosis]
MLFRRGLLSPSQQECVVVELTFLTRAGCHLCETAKATVAEVVSGRDVTVTEIDIDSDEELTGRYGWDVPVVLLEG